LAADTAALGDAAFASAGRVAGFAFRAAVPTQIVVDAVAVVLAVGLVVLGIVRH